MSTLLRVSHLAAGYGDIRVIWDVDFAIGQGAIAVLIGSNGAGKTTLLRALSGLIAPDAGAIEFDGRSLVGLPPAAFLRQGLVHVPEGRRLFASLSVQDNLLLGAYLRGDKAAVKRDIERVYTLFPRLAERRRQDVATLSGGEQQMCAIGRGLMAAPRLLLIDELSLGLAPRVVDELIEALRQVNREGTSLLVVEQDVATALSFADVAYVIDQGRTTLSGDAATLSRDPAVRNAYLGF